MSLAFHLHIVPMVPRDWGWHQGPHISSTHHLHVISVVPNVILIDTIQAVPNVSDVVLIDRGHHTLFSHAHECCCTSSPWSPGCLSIIPMIPQDYRWHQGPHVTSILSTCHLHGPWCGPIDRGWPLLMGTTSEAMGTACWWPISIGTTSGTTGTTCG